MNHILFYNLFILFFLSSCKEEYVVSDLTKEGVFTEGIEGPATDHLGNIYAVNYQKEGTVGKITPDGQVSLFLELPNGSIGNGIRFGDAGEMYIADYTNHNILRVSMETKRIDVFAHHPGANQPNDIAIGFDETVYASDPNWKKGTGNLWKVTKKNGFERLEGGMGTTNGIAVNLKDKKLYVNESIQRKIWSYDILEDGNVINKQLFYSFEDYGLDGMRLDLNGNLYVCRYDKGTIVVLSPNGILKQEIILKGKKPTNITFSNDYTSFYVTMADRGCIEVVKNK